MIRLQESSTNGYVCTTDPGEPGRDHKARLSVNDTEGHIMSYLVGGRNVLEIGTGLGVSTRYMAKSAKLVLTIDIDPWVQSYIWPELVKLHNVTTLTNYRNLSRQFDVIFIDGNHDYQDVIADIEGTRPLLHSDGFYLFHDFHIEAVKKAVIESKFFYTVIETKTGLAVAWKSKPPKEF